jgi:hypothetical protein
VTGSSEANMTRAAVNANSSESPPTGSVPPIMRSGEHGSSLGAGNPFVGPRPIQQGEALFGRDGAVRDLYNRLRARRIVVLHSPSGAGKSSLVQAGLIPKLRGAGFEVGKPIRVNLDPRGIEGVQPGSTNRYLLSTLVSLEEGRAQAQERLGPAALAGMDLRDYLARRAGPDGRSAPMVLVFDQFEELLTVEPLAVDAKRAFFSALGKTLENERYWALFALREDYLAAFAPYRDLVPTHLSHTFRLDLLDRDAAKEAAEKLAAGGMPSRAFPAAQKLVKDLSTVQTEGADGQLVKEEGPYVEPVYLQVVGRRLWARMPPEDLSIEDRHLEAYADVSTVLGGYYADAVQIAAGGDLGAERAVREWVRSKLVIGGIRSQVRRGANESAGLPNGLVDGLVGTYVVRVEQRVGATWLELSHDRLVEAVEGDNDAWEKSHLHSSQVQARLWEAGGRSRALLLGAEALVAAEAARRANDALWTKAEREYLAESRELRDEEARQRRRLWGLTFVLSVAFLAAVGAGAFAYRESEVARGESEKARSAKERAEDAEIALYEEQGRLAVLDNMPARAYAYLFKAYSMDHASTMAGHRAQDPDQRDLLTTRLLLPAVERDLAFPLMRGMDKGVRSMVFSADGARLATAGETQVQLWDARSGGQLLTLDKRATAIALSGDGRLVVIGTEDGVVEVFPAEGGKPVAPPGKLVVPGGTVSALAFSPDNRRVAIGSADGGVLVVDVDLEADRTGANVSRAKRLEGAVSALAFSPDGQVLAGGDTKGVIQLWNASNGSVKGRPYAPIPGDPIYALAFSPKGKALAAGYDCAAVVVVALEGGAVRQLVEHTGPVRAVAFSPDGKALATASEDGTARLWYSEPAGYEVWTWPTERPEVKVSSEQFKGLGAAVLAAVFVRERETGAQTIATAGPSGPGCRSASGRSSMGSETVPPSASPATGPWPRSTRPENSGSSRRRTAGSTRSR